MITVYIVLMNSEVLSVFYTKEAANRYIRWMDIEYGASVIEREVSN